MARKKEPSFDIPDTVRKANQSGWVYRTDGAHTEGRARTGRPAPSMKRPTGTKRPRGTLDSQPILAPVAAVTAPAPSPSCTVLTGGLVGFGLQVAAVPLVVPLYVTATIARRLGFVGR